VKTLYANAQAWQRFLQSRDEQTDFIVRMRWSSIRLIDEAGAVFDIIAWLKTRPAESEDHEITMWACSGKHQAPKQIRLIARRKTPEAIEKAHKDLRRHASRKQHETDPRSYVAAGFLVLATSLPAEEFPASEVLAVYRLRWQIELAFKRLKSLIKIDEIRTRTEAGTRCWLYANLIVALLADNCSQDFLESFPSGTRWRRCHELVVARHWRGAARHPRGDHSSNHTEHATAAFCGAASADG
jgi:IS4 transposase